MWGPRVRRAFGDGVCIFGDIYGTPPPPLDSARGYACAGPWPSAKYRLKGGRGGGAGGC